MFIVFASRTDVFIFTARAAYASAVLAVVILSAYLCHTRALSQTKQCNSVNYLGHSKMPVVDDDDECTADVLNTTRKGNHSVVGERRAFSSEICAQSDPPASNNADFDRFSLITSQP